MNIFWKNNNTLSKNVSTYGKVLVTYCILVHQKQKKNRWSKQTSS